MNLNDKKKLWYDAMIGAGHVPIMEENNSDELDIFVNCVGFHNGPGCSKCKWECCWHCIKIEDIPKCTG